MDADTVKRLKILAGEINREKDENRFLELIQKFIAAAREPQKESAPKK